MNSIVPAPMPEHARALLQRPLPVAVTTLEADGRPQVSVIWAAADCDSVVFFADRSSRKVRNLTRDPRVAIVVIDDRTNLGEGVPCYFSASGTAMVTEESPGELIHKLTKSHMDLEEYPFGPVHPFVLVRMLPRRYGGNLPPMTVVDGRHRLGTAP